MGSSLLASARGACIFDYTKDQNKRDPGKGLTGEPDALVGVEDIRPILPKSFLRFCFMSAPPNSGFYFRSRTRSSLLLIAN